MVVELLFCGEADCAAASWASLSFSEAFSHVAIRIVVGHVALAPGALELSLVEALLLEAVKRLTGEGRVSAGGAGVILSAGGVGAHLAESCLTARALGWLTDDLQTN